MDDREWLVDENGLAGYGDNGPNFRIVTVDGETVAELPLQHKLLDYGPTPEYKQAKAAAHLMAAAPALREALRETIAAALRQLEMMGKGREPSPRLKAAVDKARAILTEVEA